MKHVLLTLIAVTCLIFAHAQPVDWVRGLGGAGEDGALDVATDAMGNVYATGYFKDTVDFDPGPGSFTLASAGAMDIYVVKLDLAGNFVWARRFGEQLDDAGRSITIDPSGNVLVCGGFKDTVDFDPGPGVFNLNASLNYDGFILKLDASGNFLWAAEIGGPDNDWAMSVHTDASGNVLISGTFLFAVDFDPGPGTYNLTGLLRDVFVWKLSSSGSLIWARAMGGNSNDYCYTVTTDAAGNVYTAGSFVGLVDFDPGPGTYTMTSPPGVGCAFVSKLDASGNFLWANRYISTGVSEATGLAITPNAELVVTGGFKGTCDLDPGPGTSTLTSLNLDGFVLKANSGTGSTIWANPITGPADQYAIGTGVDASGNIYITGDYRGLADFDPFPGAPNVPSSGAEDVFVCTYDTYGNLLSLFTAGGAGSDWGYSLAISSTGDVHLAGTFNGVAAFGPSSSLIGGGISEGFLVKFKKCSSPVTVSSANSNVQTGNTVQFGIVSTASSFQWQESTGLGFSDLANNAQYSGVNTATLTVSNVALLQNNNLYRCLVS